MRGTSTTTAGCETSDCTKAVRSGGARWYGREGGLCNIIGWWRFLLWVGIQIMYCGSENCLDIVLEIGIGG